MAKSNSTGPFVVTLLDDSMVTAEGAGLPRGTSLCINPSIKPNHGRYVWAMFPDGRERFGLLVAAGTEQRLEFLNPRRAQIQLDGSVILGRVVKAEQRVRGRGIASLIFGAPSVCILA
jgi:SOS-response transcriptional repressor LexA